jgi:hypothetical protein
MKFKVTAVVTFEADDNWIDSQLSKNGKTMVDVKREMCEGLVFTLHNWVDDPVGDIKNIIIDVGLSVQDLANKVVN